ncbi:SDR family oxidoreductase [Sporolactobacillus terrae]|uniref:Oxidoreductase n=1 Tax=Sporolactobacillus terrae TaxID=269673 RepID=A0A5K7X4G7_9BACL|nr:SDR family oxidoreductase [Sporolactobacillus terrae]BBN99838.1 oxidoreductase [Sporolactobacillus terrae]
MTSLKNKVIIIAGASSGIGKATARRLANEGAKLVIGARRAERLKQFVDSLPDAEIDYSVADVTKPEDLENLAKLAVDRYGHIDVMFNNAGIMPTANLCEIRRDEWQQMLNINIMGVLNGIAAVLPIMKQQQSGHIIATDSVAGHIVYPGSAVYCGTKFAIRAIMEGLRQEERENNIRTTIVSPGAVDTELYTTINDPTASEWVKNNQRTPGLGLTSEQIADAIAYAIGTPETVAINELLIRPTKQSI